MIAILILWLLLTVWPLADAIKENPLRFDRAVVDVSVASPGGLLWLSWAVVTVVLLVVTVLPYVAS